MPTADISGTQRKVAVYSVRPLRSEYGSSGIALREGRSLPFVVTRGWSAPAGILFETFYLIDPDSREVLYEGPVEERAVIGLQSVTEFRTLVETPVALEPGGCAIVFALGGTSGGEFPVEVFAAVTEEAG